MISLFGKWIYATEEDINANQECFVVESEEGDWLLVDVGLIDESAVLLNDYVVVDERIFRCKTGGEKALSTGEASEGNIKKSQKICHGKMISRVLQRKMVQPYTILRPLKCKMATGEMWDTEQLQQMNSWLEMLSSKVPRPLGTLGNIPPLRFNVKRYKLSPHDQ